MGTTSATLELVHAVEYLRENPFSVSALRSVSRGLCAVGESDAAAAQYVSRSILDVLPSVMRQSSKKVVIIGLEILGALSLSSQSAHHLVLTKKEIILAVVEKFTSTDVELLTAACHALEDVLISPESLELVRESLLVENLLRMLCLLADLSGKADTGLRIVGDNMFHESAHDRHQILQISGETKTLNCQHGEKGSKGVFCFEFHMNVHTCVRIVGSLLPYRNGKNVPKSVYLKALSILQQHWLFLLEEDRVNYEGVDPSTWNWYEKPKWRHEVAKCLVLLGMEYDYFSSNSVEKSHGIAEVSLLEFKESFWERYPMLVTKSMPPCLVSFAKRYSSIENLLNNLLSRFMSCPSASADQVDSSMYLRELECTLGDPLIYGQDIRIVKTVNDLHGTKSNESEVHFFPSIPECGENYFVHPKAMVKAVEMGFSLAVKGLELRSPDIARLANAIAKQFGQPSVGVNLYVTPPNAQGLAVHFDDHCVLVCQLQGHKTWRIFPPVQLLPRLYDSRSLNEEALEASKVEKIYLQEGNVLYIPRGYPHKAFCEIKPEEKSDGEDLHLIEKTGPYFGFRETSQSALAVLSTSSDPLSGRNKKQRIIHSCSESTGGIEASGTAADDSISVHLTFGVEVEPPFEWEGLVHIALRLWLLERWRNVPEADSELPVDNEVLCEALLHVSIRRLGDMDIRFRKACMIAAEAPPHLCPEKSGDSGRKENAVDENENGIPKCGSLEPSGCHSCSHSALTYFQGLIATVNERVSFSEALEVDRSYLHNDAGEVDIVCMEWLKHVPDTNERFKDLGSLDPIRLLQQSSNLEKSACEKTFTNIKAEFGQALMFHDASQVFRIILDQYSTIRKKIRNGMLALHGGLREGRS